MLGVAADRPKRGELGEFFLAREDRLHGAVRPGLFECGEGRDGALVRRWQEFSGKTATLEATGEQFNAIEPHAVAA